MFMFLYALVCMVCVLLGVQFTWNMFAAGLLICVIVELLGVLLTTLGYWDWVLDKK